MRSLHSPATPPILGTKSNHLSDAVAALDVHLNDDEARTLEEPYTVRRPTAF